MATKGDVKIRGWVPVAVASLAHAGVLAGLAATQHAPPALVPCATNVGELDVEMTAPEEQETAAALSQRSPLSQPDAKTASERAAEDDARARGRGNALAKVSSRELTPATGTSNGDETRAVEPPAGDWSFSPVVSPVARPIDTTHAFTPDLAPHESGAADPSAPARASTTGGLAEGLAALDVAAGLGRGGSVLTAAEAAARSPEAPLRGEATFDVVVRPDGEVDARLASASADTDGWREVAGVLQRTVDGHRVRVPPGARGWHVVVQVDAKVVFADGRDTRSVHGLRGGVTPSVLSNAIEGKPGARGSSTSPGGPDHVGGEGQGQESPPVGGALGSGKATHVGTSAAVGVAMRVLPTPTVSVAGKVCSAALAITPVGVSIGGGCSLENIGSGTRRTVSGRIVREEAL
jgi:hypothetical protein